MEEKTKVSFSEPTINLGNLYEINKNMMAKQKPLSASKIREKMKEMSMWLQDINDNYYMLLNRELFYYTIFHLNSHHYTATDKACNEIIACLKDDWKFDIIDIFLNKDSNAYEFWTKDENDNIFMFPFFGYDIGVIEIKEGEK